MRVERLNGNDPAGELRITLTQAMFDLLYDVLTIGKTDNTALIHATNTMQPYTSERVK